MVTHEQTVIYRQKIQSLLQKLRNSVYADSDFKSFPTDASLAFLLGLSPTAFSSLSRGCASMNGVTLRRCLSFLSSRLNEKEFFLMLNDFLS